MSNKIQKHKTGKEIHKERHYFFLSPYKEYAITRCPQCETNTKLKKYCLLIHIEPRHFISLNKTTRYCSSCDLIIAKKEELEQLLWAICEQRFPEIIGNEYLVLGTMEANKAMNHVYLFKDIWSFEIEPGGWVYEPYKDKK